MLNILIDVFTSEIMHYMLAIVMGGNIVALINRSIVDLKMPINLFWTGQGSFTDYLTIIFSNLLKA